MNLFQIIFVPFCVLFAFSSILAKTKRLSSFRTRLAWFILFFSAAVLIAFPRLTSIIANRLGIGRGSDLILYMSLLTGVIVIRHFYIRCRRLENMLTEVIRLNSIDRARRGGE